MDELSEQARAWLADPAHAISVADARLRDAGLERRFLEAQARRRGKRLARLRLENGQLTGYLFGQSIWSGAPTSGAY